MRKRYLKKTFTLKRTVPDTEILLHKRNLECIRKNQTENSEDTLHFQCRVRQRKITKEEVRKLRKEGELIDCRESDYKDIDNPLFTYKICCKGKSGDKIIGIFIPVGMELIGITAWKE